VLSFFQATILGLLQGVTELFPVSSLGHTVIFPGLFGWHGVVAAQSARESYFLAFLVGLHVATALGLIVYFFDDWRRIITAFFRTLARRRIQSSDERLAWLLVVATIPAGLTGVGLEHVFRTVFAKPEAAAAFLMVNGVILLVGDGRRRALERRVQPVPAGTDASPGGTADSEPGAEGPPHRRLDTLAFPESFVIGVAQVLALFAGISRSGVTMVAGLFRGLDYEDAARFSFLLATPIILAAGVYKVPDLLGDNGNGVRGQILAGSAVAAVSAYLAVRFLMRYFESRRLWPFAIYCLVFGLAMVIRFSL
jgi:undecaprenyl-diphosphatase